MPEPVRMMGTLWQFGGAAGGVYYLFKLIGYGFTGSYPQAVGTVLNSELRSESGGRPGTRYTVSAAHVEYEYEVAGRKYRGDVIDAGGSIWTSFGDRAESVRRRYPGGSVVGVYYDPADPKRAFLERSPAAFLIMFIGCIGVSIAGCVMRG